MGRPKKIETYSSEQEKVHAREFFYAIYFLLEEFQLSILKNKKVLFLKKCFLSRTAKIDPKDGVTRLNFQ